MSVNYTNLINIINSNITKKNLNWRSKFYFLNLPIPLIVAVPKDQALGQDQYIAGLNPISRAKNTKQRRRRQFLAPNPYTPAKNVARYHPSSKLNCCQMPAKEQTAVLSDARRAVGWSISRCHTSSRLEYWQMPHTQ